MTPRERRPERQLTVLLEALLTLRRERLSVAELAGRLEVSARAAYRFVRALRECGVVVDEARSPAEGRGRPGTVYSVPAEPLRKVLGL